MSRPKYEVADVIERFGQQFYTQCKPNQYQQLVLNDLGLCRTAALGWHKDVCDCCSKERISYNSCRNRHCPKCQSARQAFWIENLLETTLPVKHYHIVFTVPNELNAVCSLLLENPNMWSITWAIHPPCCNYQSTDHQHR